MQRRHFSRLLYPILILLLSLNFGCSTTRSLFKKIKPDEPCLKKKIMVLPPIDLSGLPTGTAARTSEDFLERLKHSHQLSIYTAPKDWVLPLEIKRPDFGVAYYDPAIAKMAKDKDMNALLAAFLPPIENTKGRTGIWPFRYDAEIYTISIVINVMDVTNGCLYLTDFSSKEVFFPLDEIDKLTKEEIFNQILIKAMPDILERQASAVIKELEEEPWTGRILDKKSGLLMINAGKDAGVQQDYLFGVYAQGESILCQTGRKVDLLGERVGQIKAVSVLEEYTLAEPESGGPFSIGQTIMFNPRP